MDSDQHNQDGPTKPMNGYNSSEIIKSDQENKDIQEVKEKPKRKSQKGSLKAAARNLCRIKFFRSISPVKLMCRCRDLYAQTMVSCSCAHADTTAFISPESGGRTRQGSLPANSSNTCGGSSRRPEEENLR